MPQPVVALTRHSLVLKTALVKCGESPGSRTVHRLRSTARRMEAVLELLASAAELANYRQEEKPLRKCLRRIRREAGKVRDIDVHLEMLSAYRSTHDTANLKKDLGAARKKFAGKLQRESPRNEHDFQRALDNMEKALAPLADLDLSGGSVARIAQSWLATTIEGLDPRQDNGLHSIRKACKTARYIAEIGSEASKAAANLAQRLNDIQQTTGAWHDCLLLLDQAHTSLPDDSPLIEKVRIKALRLRRLAEAKAKHLHTISKLPRYALPV